MKFEKGKISTLSTRSYTLHNEVAEQILSILELMNLENSSNIQFDIGNEGYEKLAFWINSECHISLDTLANEDVIAPLSSDGEEVTFTNNYTEEFKSLNDGFSNYELNEKNVCLSLARLSKDRSLIFNSNNTTNIKLIHN